MLNLIDVWEGGCCIMLTVGALPFKSQIIILKDFTLRLPRHHLTNLPHPLARLRRQNLPRCF